MSAWSSRDRTITLKNWCENCKVNVAMLNAPIEFKVALSPAGLPLPGAVPGRSRWGS